MSTTNTNPDIIEITTTPDSRYTLRWNFGKSECGFDTKEDVVAFIRDDLPNIEKHLSITVKG